MQNSTAAGVIQQYSHHTLYTVTKLCSRRSIFSSFCRLFVWLCKFSTKPRKFTCSCLSLEFAESIALNLQDQTLLQRQPYTALAQYRYMPELIKLWKKKSNRSSKVVKLHRAPALHPLPLANPQNTFIHAVTLASCTAFQPSAQENLDIWALGALRGNFDRTALGGMEAQGDSAGPRGLQSSQLLLIF